MYNKCTTCHLVIDFAVVRWIW